MATYLAILGAEIITLILPRILEDEDMATLLKCAR